MDMADYSPMMQQYFSTKEKYPDTILLFRLGDFYEMFFEDAVTVSGELDLTLTGRDCGQEERAPMCGVPFHSAESYIAKLVAKGYKVAICEQMEDPKLVKGLVKRDVIRVITPGTVLESSMLDETKNNYLCSLCVSGNTAGLCFADVSTGQMVAEQIRGSQEEELVYLLGDRLARYDPSEILLDPEASGIRLLNRFIEERLKCLVDRPDAEEYLDPLRAEQTVSAQFGGQSMEALALRDKPLAVLAVSALLTYLQETQINGLERFTQLTLGEEQSVMGLDLNARWNLELTETLRNKERRGSLLWVLDHTKTAMGKRMIKTWIEQPLMSPARIVLRQNAVSELYENRALLDDLMAQLTGIHDLERIMSRIVYGSANGRELRSLCSALEKLPDLKALALQCGATLLQTLAQQIDPLEDIAALISAAVVEDPPFSIREGGIIREGFSAELDEVRRDMNGGTELVAAVEARERARTGIPKLRTGYNRVFGYYIEVSNSYKDQVPEDYVRKQTLANGERYITRELKDLENRILGAHDRSVVIESRLFEQVRQKVAQQLSRVQTTAHAVAVLDVLASFAYVSVKNDYTCPVINLSGRLYLKDSRHPVVEALLKDTPFVPNDVDMDMHDNRVSIITGPNMAGKSTYMRQIAIICVMAQAGCFVPAAEAELGVVDHIFTRVGASDDLSAGQSTFMIEMTEVADILKNATRDSLLIFDEIGRGTSTFDGMSIARAVLEYVQDKKLCGAKTLFATHYHELTSLEQVLPGVRNFNIAVKKRGDDITFLRRIVRGGADDSFGVEVAKLAGVPDKVIRRARQILEELESTQNAALPETNREESVQLVLDTTDSEVLQKLREVDVNSLTPIQCMNVLFELRNMLK